MKRATFVPRDIFTYKQFQSTPSWRGRLFQNITVLRVVLFQSTPSWRGRPQGVIFRFPKSEFQSTPSWRGRPVTKTISSGISLISIHALVKRATHCFEMLPLVSFLFQSTPSWRGRPPQPTDIRLPANFNPRPREEGDIVINSYLVAGMYFNPRPREEGDILRILQLQLPLRFQSTPSWRGRLHPNT